jgi:hypothetical protein
MILEIKNPEEASTCVFRPSGSRIKTTLVEQLRGENAESPFFIAAKLNQ